MCDRRWFEISKSSLLIWKPAAKYWIGSKGRLGRDGLPVRDFSFATLRPVTMCFLWGEFWTSKNIAVIRQPSYTWGLSPCEKFSLFPTIRNLLRRHPFQIIDSTQTSVTDALKNSQKTLKRNTLEFRNFSSTFVFTKSVSFLFWPKA